MIRPSLAGAAAAVVSTALAATLAAQQAPKPDPLAGLDEYLEKTRTSWKIPGLAVGVVRNDSLVYAKGFGVREAGKPEPVDTRTVFAIGSNSKSFTATAAAMLVDDGKLKWNDRVIDWIPGFQLWDPWVTRDLRLRDVLSHRSGLGRRADALWHGTDYSREEIIRRVRYLPPNAPFRTEMGYQNIMVLTGGEIVGKAAGTSWDEVIRRRIFAPLGMASSGTSVTELARQTDVATPHAIDSAGARTIPWRNIDNIAPAGSINSNVVDMAEYLRLQLGNGTYRGNRLVTAANLAATKTVLINIGGVGDSLTHFSGYGMGWVLQDYRGKRIAWHNGGIDGMLSEMWTIPELGLGIVVLSNASPHAAGPAIVMNIIDRFLLGAPAKDYLADALKQNAALLAGLAAQAKQAEAARVKDTRPSLPLAAYAGTYSDRMYGDVTVALDGDHLVLHWQRFAAPLNHWHYNTFRGVWDGQTVIGQQAAVTFQIDANGKAGQVDIGGLGSFLRH